MLILLRHGFSNRLRTLVGFWYVADRLRQSVEFHWDTKDKSCNGTWEEVFQPVSFVVSREPLESSKYDFCGESTIPVIVKLYFPEENIRWGSAEMQKIEQKYYQLLRLQKHIIDRAHQLCAKFVNFDAVHIRRTDHVGLAKSVNMYTTFDEFDEFIAAAAANGKKVYLATDSKDVQKKYPDLLRNTEIDASMAASFRQTSLSDAMVDVLVCAFADKFKGSGYSSFTGLIFIYRKFIHETYLKKQ